MNTKKLSLFVLFAFLLTACGKSSPAAVTPAPAQDVTGVISETTALLQTDSSNNQITSWDNMYKER